MKQTSVLFRTILVGLVFYFINERGALKYLFIIILVLVVGGVGVWYFTMSKANTNANDNINTSAVVVNTNTDQTPGTTGSLSTNTSTINDNINADQTLETTGALNTNTSTSNDNTNTTSPLATTTHITISDYQFTPSTLNLKAGQHMTVRLTNNGATSHSFVIDDMNVNSGFIAPGQTATVTITAPSTAGTHTFYCSVTGHRDLGMQGTLTVN